MISVSLKVKNIIHSATVVFFMVTGIVIFNTDVHHLFTRLTIIEMLHNFTLTYALAFLLIVYIIGPLVERAVMMLPYDKRKKLIHNLITTTISLFALILLISLIKTSLLYYVHELRREDLFLHFLNGFIANFLFALPFKLFIVAPFTNFLMSKLFTVK